jgi:hypothetical protein
VSVENEGSVNVDGFGGLGATVEENVNGLGATVGAEGGDVDGDLTEGGAISFADCQRTNISLLRHAVGGSVTPNSRKWLISTAVGDEEGTDGVRVGEGAK